MPQRQTTCLVIISEASTTKPHGDMVIHTVEVIGQPVNEPPILVAGRTGNGMKPINVKVAGKI